MTQPIQPGYGMYDPNDLAIIRAATDGSKSPEQRVAELDALKAKRDAERAQTLQETQTAQGIVPTDTVDTGGGNTTAPALDTSAPSNPQEQMLDALSQPQRPQYAVVGSDTYQPGQKVLRGPAPVEGQDVIDADRVLAQERENIALDKGDAAEQYELAAARRADLVADKQRQDVEADYALKNKQRADELDRREKDWMAASEKARTFKPETNRYWSSLSTGDQIMQTLAIFFGGIGQGLAGMENTSLKRLNALIDQDVELQKQQSEQGAKDKENFYSMARERFASDEARAAAARELAYANIQSRLERFKDFAKDPARQAQLERARAALEQGRIEAEQQRRTAAAGEITEQFAFDPVRTVQVGGARGGKTALDELTEREKKKNEFRATQGQVPENYVPALGAYASSKEEATALKDKFVGVKTFTDTLDRMMNLAQSGTLTPGSAAAREMASLHKSSMLALKQETQSGTLDKSMEAVANEIIPDASVLISSKENALQTLQSLKNRTIQSARTKSNNATIIEGAAPPGLRGQAAPPSSFKKAGQ